jgi:hypothetical protein
MVCQIEKQTFLLWHLKSKKNKQFPLFLVKFDQKYFPKIYPLETFAE